MDSTEPDGREKRRRRRMGPVRYVRYARKRTMRLPGAPHAIAAGIASGAAVSMFPLVGLHIVLGFVLAFFTRGNMLAAVFGTAWGNALTFPFFFAGAYQVGNWLTGNFGLAEVEAAAGSKIREGVFAAGFFDAVWPVFRTMMIGAVPIALAIYVIFYILVRTLVSRVRARRSARFAARRAAAAADQSSAN